MTNELLWKTKLHARLHDPAEKALVLLRDPAGHEGGTSKALHRLMGFDHIASGGQIDNDNAEVLHAVVFKKGIPTHIYNTVKRADWWAAAADRPQWPMQEITITNKNGEQKTLKIADFAQVRFSNKPVLVHPLTGEQFDLGKYGGLSETDIHDIKERSFQHFQRLIVTSGAETDWRKTLMSFWRFGPELMEEEDFGKLGALWRLLPADTRVPDHSIWDHLDLASAFAGAFAADPKQEVALLALSIGPVQDFIAAARTTSDLWAGSHLLSRLAWEAMKPVCTELGPDAILFPRLRGISQVDIWLKDLVDQGGCGLSSELFKDCEWMQGGTDANPLFSAALPNRFVAIVPASQAGEIAERVTRAVRDWLRNQGEAVVNRLLKEVGLNGNSELHCHRQMREQLEGFPEVHWAAIPFSLIHPANTAKQTELDTSALSSAMAPFFNAQSGKDCGFLDTPAWQALSKEIAWNDNTTFFAPNPGVLYPAVYDLAERILAAAKSARRFEQSKQHGWRCSLTGETEWLATEKGHLAIPAGKRKSRMDKQFREGEHVETLWTKVADAKRAWAKKGEHLGALPAIKRLWPTLFAEEVERAIGNSIGRFVVSTHTMALAKQIDQWLERGGIAADGFVDAAASAESVALPRKLMRRHANNKALAYAKRIPGVLEAAGDEDTDASFEQAKNLVRRTLAQGADAKDEIKLETYYALLMMDGDHMGAILSGDESAAISYRDSFHPQVQKGFDEHAAKQPLIRDYGAQKRPISPNRHLAISGALNDFSQAVVRHVIEEEHLGRVIYAGGDDVLAMLPVANLLSTMQRLRHAYSGCDPEHEGGVLGGLTLQKGFAALKTRRGGKETLQLMRMMGSRATASCGAVIASLRADEFALILSSIS